MTRGLYRHPVPCRLCPSQYAAPKDGLCLGCRGRLLRQKYFWNPAKDEIVRRAWTAGTSAQELRRQIAAATRLIGYPRHMVRMRASRLGLTHDKRRPWSPEDKLYLREHAGTVSVKKLASSLGRSHTSVLAALDHLRIAYRLTEGYTIEDLHALLGVATDTVRQWERHGWIRRYYGRFHDPVMLRFLQTHPEEYDLRRVDQAWFKGILFPRAPCFTPELTLKRQAAPNGEYDDDFGEAELA